MDSEYDITLNPGEENVSNTTKDHFLDSLGLGERTLLDGGREGDREAMMDEGVVLSSIPDDLGYPGGSAEPARGLAVSFSVTRDSSRTPITAITLPSDEDPEPVVESPAATPVQFSESAGVPTIENDPDDVLNLTCPDCDGALVLKRRHLGVDGVCVWCHTAIVAAESGRDGQVRIFPILGAGPLRPVASETPAPEVVPETDPLVGEIDGKESKVEAEPTVFDLKAEAVDEKVAEEPAFGFLPSMEETPETTRSAAFGEVESIGESSGVSEVEIPLDLESLYDTGGFLAPAEDLRDSAPSFAPTGPSLASLPAGPDVSSPLPGGFGAFLANPAPVVQEADAGPASGFPGPTPWGPPVRPATTPVSQRRSEEKSGIEPEDEAPAPLPEGFAVGFGVPESDSAPTWESAFGAVDESRKPRAFPAPENEDTLAAAFGSPFGTGSAADSDEAPSGFSMLASPPAASLIQNPPANEVKGFATQSFAPIPQSNPSAGSGSAETGIFPGRSDPGVLPWGMPSATPKEVLPAAAESPGFEPTNAIDADSLFAPAPSSANLLFGTIETPAPSSPFVPTAVEPALAPLPAPPAAPATGVAAVTVAPVLPNVVAQSLGSKPKPKVRKSFLVLMVVILGFASGAALASFVLPVDRYVAAARAYMESKFDPKPAVPVMPALPASPAAPGAPVPPSDFQP